MSQATCLYASQATRTPGLPAWGYVTRLAAAVGRLARPWRRRTAIRDLHRLGDRALRDIGIDRGEIDAIVDAMMKIRRHARQSR